MLVRQWKAAAEGILLSAEATRILGLVALGAVNPFAAAVCMVNPAFQLLLGDLVVSVIESEAPPEEAVVSTLRDEADRLRVLESAVRHDDPGKPPPEGGGAQPEGDDATQEAHEREARVAGQVMALLQDPSRSDVEERLLTVLEQQLSPGLVETLGGRQGAEQSELFTPDLAEVVAPLEVTVVDGPDVRSPALDEGEGVATLATVEEASSLVEPEPSPGLAIAAARLEHELGVAGLSEPLSAQQDDGPAALAPAAAEGASGLVEPPAGVSGREPSLALPEADPRLSGPQPFAEERAVEGAALSFPLEESEASVVLEEESSEAVQTKSPDEARADTGGESASLDPGTDPGPDPGADYGYL